jgi:hypothetical protein
MKKFNFPNPFDYFKAGQEAIKDFSKEKKKSKETKSQTIIVENNGYAELENSYTDESSGYLINPSSFNLAMDLHPIYLNGEKYFIQSKNDHETCNINKIAEIMADVKYKCDLFITLTDTEKIELYDLINNSTFKTNLIEKFKDQKIISRIRVENISCTINPNFFSNKFSYSFTIQAFKVIQTKILTFLEDNITRKLFIAAIIISILIGIIIGVAFGSVITAFLSGFLFYMIK